MLSHPGLDKNHVYLMHRLCRKSRIYVVKWRWVFTAVTSKNDVTLCKLDVNVKNRTAVAGSVDFFNLESKLFNGKSNTLQQVLLWKSNVVNQKVCKKKYLSWVYGVDRKIRHSGSLIGITRQASWCRSVTLVTDFSVHTIHQWKILIIPRCIATFSWFIRYSCIASLKTGHCQNSACLDLLLLCCCFTSTVNI